jgi:hypothetical protein
LGKNGCSSFFLYIEEKSLIFFFFNVSRLDCGCTKNVLYF